MVAITAIADAAAYSACREHVPVLDNRRPQAHNGALTSGFSLLDRVTRCEIGIRGSDGRLLPGALKCTDVICRKGRYPGVPGASD